MPVALDRELLEQLAQISEIEASGFSVREGLTGRGVTVLKGRTYFGSWRVVDGMLLWSYSDLSRPVEIAATVDEAARVTLLHILRNLETGRARPEPRALAG